MTRRWWVVCDGDLYTWRCLGCGEVYAFTSFPAPFAVVTAACKAYAKEHRSCGGLAKLALDYARRRLLETLARRG